MSRRVWKFAVHWYLVVRRLIHHYITDHSRYHSRDRPVENIKLFGTHCLWSRKLYTANIMYFVDFVKFPCQTLKVSNCWSLAVRKTAKPIEFQWHDLTALTKLTRDHPVTPPVSISFLSSCIVYYRSGQVTPPASFSLLAPPPGQTLPSLSDWNGSFPN